ncbi:MAG: D-glycerate dehydrogenase, partial [Sphingomonadales bacterium]
SLHCPSSEATRGMLSAERIAAMKPGATIVNTARADLIDYGAMIEALESGHLGGAGLDVFPDEPHVDPRLIALPNVIAQPHIGSATIEGREASGEKVIANIRFWADGHRPPDQVLEGLV